MSAAHAQAPPRLWTSYVGGSADDYAAQATELTGKRTLVVGQSFSSDYQVPGNYGLSDGLIYLLDSTGRPIWIRNLGGPGNDLFREAYPTPTHNIIAVGSAGQIGNNITANKGGTDAWVVQLDTLGNVMWSNTYGSSGNEVANSLVVLPTGEMIIAGVANGNNGDITNAKGGQDYWVCKLSASGSLLWQKTYGGSTNDVATKIVVTQGGYYVAGYSNSTNGQVTAPKGENDYWVIKIDGDGDLIWQKSLGGSAQDYGRGISATPDGGSVVVGQSNSANGDLTNPKGNNDFWIVRLAENGNILWQKNYGGSNDDRAFSIAAASANNYLVAGFSNSGDGDVYDSSNSGNLQQQYWMFLMDPQANLLWQKTWGGDFDDRASSIAATTDNGALIAGYSNSYGPPNFGYVANVLRLGNYACVPAAKPTLGASTYNVCPGRPVNLSVSAGMLNGSAQWVWRANNCSGTIVGTGDSIWVNPTGTTTYCVRGEGGCSQFGEPTSVTVSERTDTLCPITYTFIGKGNVSGNWSDTTNWKDLKYPGTIIRYLDTVLIDGTGAAAATVCHVDSNISNAGIIQIKATNQLEIPTGKSISLENNGPNVFATQPSRFFVDSLAELEVKGVFYAANSELVNHGEAKIDLAATLVFRHTNPDGNAWRVFQPTLSNYGLLENYASGTFRGATILNRGTFNNAGALEFIEADVYSGFVYGNFFNSGTLINNSSIYFKGGGEFQTSRFFENSGYVGLEGANGSFSSSVHNKPTGSIDCNDNFSNFGYQTCVFSGELRNEGTIWIQDFGGPQPVAWGMVGFSGKVNNSGAINLLFYSPVPVSVRDTIYNTGKFLSGYFGRFATLNLEAPAYIENRGLLGVHGHLNLNVGATISNFGKAYVATPIFFGAANKYNEISGTFKNYGDARFWGPTRVTGTLHTLFTIPFNDYITVPLDLE